MRATLFAARSIFKVEILLKVLEIAKQSWTEDIYSVNKMIQASNPNSSICCKVWLLHQNFSLPYDSFNLSLSRVISPYTWVMSYPPQCSTCTPIWFWVLFYLSVTLPTHKSGSHARIAFLLAWLITTPPCGHLSRLYIQLGTIVL